MTDSRHEPSCVTISKSRYGGTYEPGRWIALAMRPNDVPPECFGDDIECAEFFRQRREEIGGGDTPESAYDDLLRRLADRDRA